MTTPAPIAVPWVAVDRTNLDRSVTFKAREGDWFAARDEATRQLRIPAARVAFRVVAEGEQPEAALARLRNAVVADRQRAAVRGLGEETETERATRAARRGKVR